MNSKLQLLILWSILAVANIFVLVTDITDNVDLPRTLFGIFALAAAFWLLWDAYVIYKRDRGKRQQDLMAMHNVFVSLHHAEDDAKATAAKIASEMQHNLRNL